MSKKPDRAPLTQEGMTLFNFLRQEKEHNYRHQMQEPANVCLLWKNYLTLEKVAMKV